MSCTLTKHCKPTIYFLFLSAENILFKWIFVLSNGIENISGFCINEYFHYYLHLLHGTTLIFSFASDIGKIKFLHYNHLWDCTKVGFMTTLEQSKWWFLIRGTVNVENDGKLIWTWKRLLKWRFSYFLDRRWWRSAG